MTKAQLGGSTTRESAQFSMIPSVAISDMKVMISDAPSRAPRIGRKESERNSKNESTQANLPRTPPARAAALISSSVSWRLLDISGSSLISL